MMVPRHLVLNLNEIATSLLTPRNDNRMTLREIGGYGAIFVGLWIYWLAEHGTGKSISTDNTAP